ncbi:MAG: hypothetical protein AB2L20_28710 [Mangrovibacterium sp.]
MKKIELLLLILALVFVGCKDDKDLKNTMDIFLVKLQSVSSDVYAGSSIPEWLAIKINEIENRKDIDIVKVKIFQGEWNEKVVYFIRHNLNSCIFCEVYYEGGEKIVWSTEDILDAFCTTSKRWKIIYEYGNGIF